MVHSVMVGSSLLKVPSTIMLNGEKPPRSLKQLWILSECRRRGVDRLSGGRILKAPAARACYRFWIDRHRLLHRARQSLRVPGGGGVSEQKPASPSGQHL